MSDSNTLHFVLTFISLFSQPRQKPWTCHLARYLHPLFHAIFMQNNKCEQCWNISFSCASVLLFPNPFGSAERGRVCAASCIWSLGRGGEERDLRDAQSRTVRFEAFSFFLVLMQLFAILLLLRETSLNVSLLKRWIIQGNATWLWSVKSSAAELHGAFCVTNMEQNAKSGGKKTSILRSRGPKTSKAESPKVQRLSSWFRPQTDVTQI